MKNITRLKQFIPSYYAIIIFSILFFRTQDLTIWNLPVYADSILSTCNSKTHVCTVKHDNGGYYMDYLKTYDLLMNSNYKLRLEGDCISACTYLVNYMAEEDPDSVCITPKARFFIHAAYGSKSGIVQTVPYTGKLRRIMAGRVLKRDVFEKISFEGLEKLYDVCDEE